MKNKFKYLCIIVIGGAIILFNLSGCFSKSPLVTPSQGMTPVETVQFYFEQWNNKNTNGMNSVVRDEMKGSGSGNSHLVYVKLTQSVEETEKHMNLEGTYFSDTYPGYVEYSVVEVEFEIEFKSYFLDFWLEETGGFGVGKHNIDNWSYTLGKINEESDWIILDWGV